MQGSHKIDWAAFEAEAIAMIRAVVPEFAGIPLYLVDSSKLPGAVTTGAAARGEFWPAACTGRRFDLIVKPYVEWEGPGLAMIYDRSIFDQSSMTPEECRLLVHALMTHEWAHSLREGHVHLLRADEAEAARWEKSASVCRESMAATFAGEVSALTKSMELVHHDEQWTRTCCHLKFRLEQLGKLIPVEMIINRRLRPRGEFFLHALEEEVRLFANAPIINIILLPLPAEFKKLWQQRVQHFQQQERENMSIGEFLKTVGSAFQRRQTARIESYEALVRVLAEEKGKEKTTKEEVLDILDKAQKRPEQLTEDIERVRHRMELRKKIDAATGVPEARKATVQKIIKVQADLERAQKEHDEAMVPLFELEKTHDALERAAELARSELWHTAPESLKARHAELGLELGRCAEEKRVLAARIRDCDESIRNLRNIVQRIKETNVGFMPSKAASLEENENALAERERERTECDRNFAEIEKRIAGIEQKMKALELEAEQQP